MSALLAINWEPQLRGILISDSPLCTSDAMGAEGRS